MNNSINLIIPKRRVHVGNKIVIFLAGPIRGGGDWQAKAIRKIAEIIPAAYIVCPCRYDEDHELYKTALKDEPNFGLEFSRQKLWERFYLEIAARQGCILFWLPEEDKINPRTEGPYGRDSYGEIGEWRARLFYQPGCTSIVVGGDATFSGFEQIKVDFWDMIGDDFPFYLSLEATIDAALLKATE